MKKLIEFFESVYQMGWADRTSYHDQGTQYWDNVTRKQHSEILDKAKKEAFEGMIKTLNGSQYLPAYPIELSKDQVDVFGRPNFGCAKIAKYLMAKGIYKKGPSKAEYEQAVCIHFLMGMLELHGENWAAESDKFLEGLSSLPAGVDAN